MEHNTNYIIFHGEKIEVKNSMLHIGTDKIPIETIASVEVYKIKGIPIICPILAVITCIGGVFLNIFYVWTVMSALSVFLFIKTKDHFSIAIINNESHARKYGKIIHGDIKNISLLKDDIASILFHSYTGK